MTTLSPILTTLGLSRVGLFSCHHENHEHTKRQEANASVQNQKSPIPNHPYKDIYALEEIIRKKKTIVKSRKNAKLV